ncbi:hypothetical protein ACFE6N_04575 [Pedobacter sp. BG31]|uniref:hypothetical protein n=1 Tax=Pedobacter sp. BG31 TaxID=3349697 RepID=UPI0035F431E5
MSIKTIVPVKLHKSAKRKEFEGKVTAIELDKPEFFKFAVYVREVKKHIKESDFDYLQSFVPSMEFYYDDLIELTADKIINLSTDDRNQQFVSELAGVAVGLKYSTMLLNIELNKFAKTGVPVEGKYMDYNVVSAGKLYELEAKGTTQPYFTKMVNDIIAKKKKSEAFLKFGTIAAIEGHRHSRTVECVVVDDPPVEGQLVDADYFRNQLNYYAVFLGFILDSKYYNRYVSRMVRKASPRRSIAEGKFFARYEFNGRIYLGECFDYRLIRRNVELFLENRQLDKERFEMLTQSVGRTKFFIGLDEAVISAINTNNREFMENYRSERILNDGDGLYKFLDTDGILIVKSKDGWDKQLEQIFTEEEVKKRLGLYEQYVRGVAH